MSTSRVHPLYRLASAPLCEASSELLAELALIVWYVDDAAVGLQSVLDNNLENCTKLMCRRAIYLIDRLRRFPCITNKNAHLLKAFVSSCETLKPDSHSEKAKELLSVHKLEKLAFDWGLEEDIGLQMKSVLQFQTRHYAELLGTKNGYKEN